LKSPPVNGGALNAAVAIAPGAFYREHPETGAGGENLCRIAGGFGCRTHVIRTESVGSAACNGQIITRWLQTSDDENIILCSLSKGGADVKMALAGLEAADAFRNVVAWVNVGGVTSGSPMAEWILQRPLLAAIYRALFRCRGQDFQFVRDVARSAGSPLDFKLSMPPHMRVIHVLGFPLVHHIRTRRTRRWHRRLSCYGPNDGATVVADSLDIPGHILPIWGADHYFNTPRRPETILAALLHYLGEELDLFVRPRCSHPVAALPL
jgi:hypothetical protein